MREVKRVEFESYFVNRSIRQGNTFCRVLGISLVSLRESAIFLHVHHFIFLPRFKKNVFP